eukprot:gene4140-5181_t
MAIDLVEIERCSRKPRPCRRPPHRRNRAARPRPAIHRSSKGVTRMDITEINPIEYGGAIAHVAAAQLFQILTASENMEGPSAVNWFGGEEGQDDAAATVLLLAEYVTKRGAGGERLWIWGSINGLIVEGVPESRQFGDAPLYRRLAFDMFAS